MTTTKQEGRRNLNVSLSISLYRRIRQAVAAEDMSISGFVAALLARRVGGDTAGNMALTGLVQEARKVRARQKKSAPSLRPTRDELHGGEA